MKKYISVLTALLLIFTSIPLISNAAASDSFPTSEAKLLYDLGIVDFENASDAAVTRIEFTRYAMSLAGVSTSPSVGTAFTDVDPASDDYKYVMAAVDFGLISVAPSFRPNDFITLNEAAKIMVKLLSYDYLAEQNGGYPYGYLQTATQIGLMQNVTLSSEALTRAAAVHMLCNALDVKLPEVSYAGNGEMQFTIGSGTILEKYRNITLMNGKVDGGTFYSAHSNIGLGEDMISIDGYVLKSGNFDADSLIGYNIDAYVDTKTNTLMSYYITETNKIIKIYAEDIESYSNRKFVYNDGDKEKDVSISLDITILFNGKEFNFDADKIVPESGSLTFVSSDGDNSFDTLLVKSYKTIVVDRISTSKYLIIDKYDSTNNINLDPSKTDAVITNHDGKKINFDSISEGDILCAAVSDDGSVAEIICVRDSFLGTYTGNSANGIEIDGTPYKLTNALAEKVGQLVSMGKQASFRFDIDGRVADIVAVIATNEQVGYLVEGKRIVSGMDDSLKVRILRADSKIYEYSFAKAFSINGIGYKDTQKAYDNFKSSEYDSLVCGIVKFSTDDDGNIRTMVYPESGDSTRGLYETYRIETTDSYCGYAESSKSIRKRIFADTDALVFRVPNPKAAVGSFDEKDYSVIPVTEIGEDGVSGFQMIGYTTKADDGMAQYITMQALGNEIAEQEIAAESHPRMVNAIKRVMIDGENYDAMELCDFQSGATPVTVYSETEGEFASSGIKPGDLVRVELKENNIVRKFEIVYKTGSARFENGSTLLRNSNATTPLMYVRLVHAYDFKGDILEMLPLDHSLDTATPDQMEPYYMPLFKVLKYDTKQKCVVECELSDVLDYTGFGTDCSKLVYHIRYSYPRTLFIVE